MLSEKTIQIVKATAPILEKQGENLTRHFYKRMFSHNPEVLPLFNLANQAAGSQQKALAGAICAYAKNIDNLDALTGTIEQIVQKHASLQIKPEHYPVVGENLLASIKAVLGGAASNDVIDAWAEAFGFLSDIFIGREAEIYAGHESFSGGWRGFKDFRVSLKQKESVNITSFYLMPIDGGPVPDFKPGQYITVRVSTAEGSTTMRNYSLSDKPGQPYLRISVKRELGSDSTTPDGYVSNRLHSDIEVGSVIEVGPPCGEFCIDFSEKSDRPLIFLAAGIGITPICSMLHSALESMPDRQIVLIHAILNEDVQPFKSVFDRLATEHRNLTIHYRYSEPATTQVLRTNNASTGLVDMELIESLAPSCDADYFFCGPKPFMISIHQSLVSSGIPKSRLHFEFFGPRAALLAKPAIF